MRLLIDYQKKDQKISHYKMHERRILPSTRKKQYDISKINIETITTVTRLRTKLMLTYYQNLRVEF